VDGSHIRTLLLTFFYRQMRELVDAGHIYIAQPPLYRAKRGKSETYIKDDRELEQFLIRRAAEARTVTFVSSSRQVSGAELEALLHRLAAFSKQLRLVERRCPDATVVRTLVDRDVRDKGFFADRGNIESLAAALAAPTRTVALIPDEEHSGYALAVESRVNGYSRHFHVGVDLTSSSEYRALLLASREVKDYAGEVVVSEGARAAEDAAADVVEPSSDAAPETARPAGQRSRETTFGTVEELVDYFLSAGRKGVAINRYKGLGEMNPEQLWETTMKPESRTMLQVRAEDHAEADLMFTTLMGDQVEPRRKFIEENALDVKNLDI
jgi:DNA gyrase subunit B